MLEMLEILMIQITSPSLEVCEIRAAIFLVHRASFKLTLLRYRVLQVEFSIICGAFFVFCWHRTRPEIGQLQDAHSELLRKGALLHCLSCLGLCWHRTRPEIGQLQGAPCSSCYEKRRCSNHLSVPWSLLAPDSTRNRTTSRCPFPAAMKRGVVPCVCPALVFVGTGLNQKSDNFKVPFSSCYEKRRRSCICPALVFVGTGLDQKSDNLNVPLSVLSCLGLCWHRTRPEIGQLQGAHAEQL